MARVMEIFSVLSFGCALVMLSNGEIDYAIYGTAQATLFAAWSNGQKGGE